MQIYKILNVFIYFQFCINFLYSQAARPFSHYKAKHTKGIIMPTVTTPEIRDSNVCSFYKDWKAHYIKSDGEGHAYILAKNVYKRDNDVFLSRSEAQGYGLIIVALMAGYDKLDTTSQKTFDSLYLYCKAHFIKDHPYLMAWAQTSGFINSDNTSATDGDMDIAYSLLLANAQWGSNGNIDYLNEAKKMIGSIGKEEINSITFTIKKSEAVEGGIGGSKDYFDMRSSDFMPSHLRSFAKVSNDSLWIKVIDHCYTLFALLQNEYSPVANLIPDFIQHINKHAEPAKPKIPFVKAYEESIKHDGHYDYNACRVPWRIASDYILFGDKEERSKMIVQKINNWIINTTQSKPSNISAGYTLNGKPYGKQKEESDFDAMCFMTPFAVSAMVDSSNQAWLNNLWSYILHFNIDRFDYYNNTIKMFNLIILTGHYWEP